MRFEINLRDGSAYEVEAAYIEVVDGPTCSTFTLLGSVPGHPVAILAAIPVDEARCVLPAL